ncbi:MAG: 23S rRNA (uracil(1939)-C(5))-methyltransferase RlmD [Eubacterium sp.]|nr:23S rRNA (uracil(1939)-C(5))-methyltransferase RlmD [Eubacterium sp.]
MKRGDLGEGIISHVDFPNKGIVRVDDTEVTVKNGIPGQKVRFRINKKKQGRLEGQLLEVLEKSPLETRDQGCSIFPLCGGCTYRTMAYEDQLKVKEDQIRDLLTNALVSGGQFMTGDAEVNINGIYEGIKASPIEAGYRNKMEYSFGDSEKGGPLTLGLHKKNSTFDILTAGDCKIVHEDFNRILSCVLDFCREMGWPYFHKITHKGFLRHLLVRRAVTTGEILVDLVTTSRMSETIPDEANPKQHPAEFPQDDDTKPEQGRIELQNHLPDLSLRLQKLDLDGRLVGFLHTTNDSVADVIKDQGTEILFGRDYFYEEILGLKFKITPFSFFQTNSKGAEVLYSTARDYLGSVKDLTVYDLYSGTGTIAQVLAPVAKKVVGVEIVEEAVEAAKINAAGNGLDNCEFLAGDVLKVLDSLTEKPDVIVLDPPREGVHPKALPKIIGYGVERIVYISCKPTSLARDLQAFLAAGYRVEKAAAVDMFPNTPNVEVVALLGRKKV